MGGYDSGWRLPTRHELARLVDYGKGIPAEKVPAVKAPFRNTASDFYWTATTYAGDAIIAWHVDFKYGYVADSGLDNIEKNASEYVRCVHDQGE